MQNIAVMRKLNKTRSKYIWGDSRNLIEYLSKSSVQLFLTSPPYFDLLNYGDDPRQIGYGFSNYEAYLQAIRAIFKQCLYCAKDSGTLWVIVDTFRREGGVKFLPADIVKECESAGWILKDIIIWNKCQTSPWSRKGQLRNQFEYILFFAKSKKYKYRIDRIRDVKDLKQWWVKYPERYAPMGKVPSNIWEFPIPVQGSWAKTQLNHACPIPWELAERIIAVSSDEGDLVVDPFAGSGTALAQAAVMGRRYFGVDNQQEYQAHFYKTILPLFAARKKTHVATQNPFLLKQNRFNKLVLDLRILKFPWVLSRLLHKKIPNSTIVAIVALQKKHNTSAIGSTVAQVEYTLIFDGLPRLSYKSAVSDLAKHPPLSKFGIGSDIRLVRAKDGLRWMTQLNRTKTLYSYENGKTHSYTKAYGPRELTPDALGRLHGPVIFSPMKVRVEIPGQ